MRRRLLVGSIVAVATVAGVVLILAPGETAGLGALPPIGEVSAIGDDVLLDRVQAELSRRSGGDWHRLPDGLRELWMVGAVEDGIVRGGLLPMVLSDGDPALAAHRPGLAALPAAYRVFALDAAAAVLAEAAALAAARPPEVQAWAAHDASDPARRPPPDPCAGLGQRFRAAVATSAAVRRAWIRAHAAAFAP